MKLNKYYSLLMALIMGLLSCSVLYAEEDMMPMIGPVPTFDLPVLDSSKSVFTQREFKSCVSLLVFWASWCPTCRSEHPFLIEMQNTYKIPIYGIDYQDNPDEARAFLKRAGNPFSTIGEDAAGMTAMDFGIMGLPETFVIDKEGKVLFHHKGPLDKNSWDAEIMPLIRTCQNNHSVL